MNSTVSPSTEIPDWATPDAWDASEAIADKAELLYRTLAKQLALEETRSGQFIIISSQDISAYVIGKTETEVDDLWRTKFGNPHDAVLFEIGNI
jgi:hypothetical protein